MKLAPGWALIKVNFDPILEIGPKVGGGHSLKILEVAFNILARNLNFIAFHILFCRLEIDFLYHS